MQKRIYKISTPAGIRLVNAGNPAQAIRHVSRTELGCSIPGQHELYQLFKDGIELEEATRDQDRLQLLIEPAAAPDLAANAG